MRTYGLVLGALLVLTFATSSATAATTTVDDVLVRFGLLPEPRSEGSDDAEVPDLHTPGVPVASEGFLSKFGNALLVASGPAAFVSKTLVGLGLLVVSGLFEGFSEGGSTLSAAASSIAEAPAQSGAIAAITLAIAGIAGGLVVLAVRFGGLAAVPLYSRIAKSQLLENEMRQQIFELIRNNPGINVSEIARRLDIAWGTATHHIHKLRHEKMIGVRVVSNQKCFFPNGGTYTPREMDVMTAVKHPTARQIAEFLIRAGARSHGDIAGALSLSPALVSFHTRKLVDFGVVARHRDGRHTIFTALEPTLDPEPRPAHVH